MKKIERLGDNGGDVVSVYASDLDEIEQQMDKAIRLLVRIYDNKGEEDKLYILADRVKSELLKLTGQSWEEIKEPPCKN